MDVYVCVCVCVCERERERERGGSDERRRVGEGEGGMSQQSWKSEFVVAGMVVVGSVLLVMVML